MKRSIIIIAFIALSFLTIQVAGSVVDDRITLLASGVCLANPRVSFSSEIGVIDGRSINNLQGRVLYTGTERILDAVSSGGIDYILGASGITIRQAKKPLFFPFNTTFLSGSILTSQPNFWAYSLTDSGGTSIFTQTPTARHMIISFPFAVKSRMDRSGNIIIADDRKVGVLNVRQELSKLFEMPRSMSLVGLDILPSDNGILLSTNSGLFKLTLGSKLYSLITGTGRLESVSNQYFWCDEQNGRYKISGLDDVGNEFKDRVYADKLLLQAKKLIALGAKEEALKKYLKALELMPSNSRLQELIVQLGTKIKNSKAQNPNL